MKRGHRYDHGFKLEAIKLIAERGMTKTQVAHDLGMSVQSLTTWIDKYAQDREKAEAGDIPPSRPTPAVTVSPNPSHSPGQLNVTLHEPASLDIGIYDVLGRRIQKLEFPDMPAGSHVVNVGRYRSGIYLLVIDLMRQRGDVQRITRKVTIVD